MKAQTASLRSLAGSKIVEGSEVEEVPSAHDKNHSAESTGGSMDDNVKKPTPKTARPTVTALETVAHRRPSPTGDC